MPGNQRASNSQPLTTFVQVDTATFKEVVQQLTGLSKTAPETLHEAASVKGNICIKKPAFELHERRQYKTKLGIIKPPLNFKQGTAASLQNFQEEKLWSPEHGFSPSGPGFGVLRSSPLSTPTKFFSSLSLGESERGEESSCGDLNIEEEEKAIRERRFYLHPSPTSRAQFSEPELLSLFPLTSPKNR